jgi:hypothetical protein
LTASNSRADTFRTSTSFPLWLHSGLLEEKLLGVYSAGGSPSNIVRNKKPGSVAGFFIARG